MLLSVPFLWRGTGPLHRAFMQTVLLILPAGSEPHLCCASSGWGFREEWKKGPQSLLTSPTGDLVAAGTQKEDHLSLGGGKGLAWCSGGGGCHPSPESHQCSAYGLPVSLLYQFLHWVWCFTKQITHFENAMWMIRLAVGVDIATHRSSEDGHSVSSWRRQLSWEHLSSGARQVRFTCCIRHDSAGFILMGGGQHPSASAPVTCYVADVYVVWTHWEEDFWGCHLSCLHGTRGASPKIGNSLWSILINSQKARALWYSRSFLLWL